MAKENSEKKKYDKKKKALPPENSDLKVLLSSHVNIYAGESAINDGGKIHIAIPNQIESSFNKVASADIQPDLKDALQQLTQAVAAMIHILPPQQAIEVTEDLTRLVDEAIKPNPNKKWYSVSIEGLARAAETIDGLGESVVKLTGKILTLLGTSAGN